MILDTCTKRNDEWSRQVKARIDFVNDLHAADAVYHTVCNVNFRTLKQVPKQFLSDESSSAKRFKVGRPKDMTQAEAFTKVIEYLEKNDEEQIIINDLVKKMGEYLADTESEPYSSKYMKQQIN
jgi:hypothetical protein